MINLMMIGIVFTSLCFQILMNFISKKINYKLDAKQYIGSLLLTPLCSYIIFDRYTYAPISFLILAICIILISSAMIDWKYQELPDSYNLIVALLSISILILLIVVYNTTFKSIVPNILSSLMLFFSSAFIAIISNGAIGGGDVKLVGAVGFLFHYNQLLRLLMYSFYPASLFALFLIIFKGKRKCDKFAFGPFLVFGIITTLLTM